MHVRYADRLDLGWSADQPEWTGEVRVHGVLRDYETEFLLVADQRGNVVLRATDECMPCVGVHGSGRRVASETLIAIDLADFLDTRARTAGLRALSGTGRCRAELHSCYDHAWLASFDVAATVDNASRWRRH